MAVKDVSNPSAASRRLFFGTNVAVMVLLAVFLLVAVNLLAHHSGTRADLSGGFAGHRISDRTKKVLDQAGDDLSITTVYASDAPGTARKEFFPKVQDLCTEIREHKRSATVQHIRSSNDQAELRDRIQKKFGTAAAQYDEVITQAQAVWGELAELLRPQREMIAGLLNSDAWLSGFSTLANIAAVLQKDLKNIEDTRRDVDDLVRGEGLPRYQEANTKIRDANNELKRHLEQAQNWLKEMDKLVKALGDPSNEFAQTTRQRNAELAERLASLRKIAGEPTDPSIPEDPKPTLQEFAKAALQLADWLNEEARRVDTFVTSYPAIRQYPKWQVQRGIFVMDLPMLLTSTAEDLSTSGRELRRILQEPNIPLDQLQNVVRQLRGIGVSVGENLKQWSDTLTAILDEAARVDDASKDFLARGGEGEIYSKPLTRLNEIATKISELPELKLDEIATRLRDDNIIVVERGDQVKVITFDETWPLADPMGGMRGSEDGATPRVFDGDTAISNALLAMIADKPVAKVVLVTFEEQVPPQMRQMQRPMTGPMPLESIRFLREKLEAMQFKVEEWNLAEEGAKDRLPTTEEGVPIIHIFLPPPPPPPPFMRSGEQKTFTPQDAEIARRVLGEKGRGLFLALWMQQPMQFGPPIEYGWGPILRDDWGVDVDTQRRVIRGVVDRREPGRYGINVVQWWYMQLNSFTEHAIGYPLRARRMLIKDACPINIAEQVPEHVKLQPVLEAPKGATDLWAEQDIERIFMALQTGARDGSFTRSEQAVAPPFPVILAGENSDKNSKIVVMGNALSVRDDYLQQRVVRFGEKATRLMTDPPPTENADLFVNALYWLADRPDLIAAGPAEVPIVGPIEPGSRSFLWFMNFAWTAAVVGAGVIMWFVRRK